MTKSGKNFPKITDFVLEKKIAKINDNFFNIDDRDILISKLFANNVTIYAFFLGKIKIVGIHQIFQTSKIHITDC